MADVKEISVYVQRISDVESSVRSEFRQQLIANKMKNPVATACIVRTYDS